MPLTAGRRKYESRILGEESRVGHFMGEKSRRKKEERARGERFPHGFGDVEAAWRERRQFYRDASHRYGNFFLLEFRIKVRFLLMERQRFGFNDAYVRFTDGEG